VKKRILFTGVVLALIALMAMPAQSFAKAGSDRPQITTGSFYSTNPVYISDQGKTTQKGMRLITRGEIMQSAAPVSCDWSALNGATIMVQHSSEITLAPTSSTTGTFSGTAINIIKVYPAAGGQLTGVSPTTLRGNYILDPTHGMIVKDVTDTGNYYVMGQVPGPDGRCFVQSSGSLNASLNWSGMTLLGSAVFNGDYRMLSR
jgi:hypothetical protein